MMSIVNNVELLGIELEFIGDDDTLTIIYEAPRCPIEKLITHYNKLNLRDYNIKKACHDGDLSFKYKQGKNYYYFKTGKTSESGKFYKKFKLIGPADDAMCDVYFEIESLYGLDFVLSPGETTTYFDSTFSDMLAFLTYTSDLADKEMPFFNFIIKSIVAGYRKKEYSRK